MWILTQHLFSIGRMRTVRGRQARLAKGGSGFLLRLRYLRRRARVRACALARAVTSGAPIAKLCRRVAFAAPIRSSCTHPRTRGFPFFEIRFVARAGTRGFVFVFVYVCDQRRAPTERRVLASSQPSRTGVLLPSHSTWGARAAAVVVVARPEAESRELRLLPGTPNEISPAQKYGFWILY